VSDLLVADGLTKVYRNAHQTTAVDQVAFSLARGEFVGLVGQSGSGKSTLMNLLGLLDTPSAGRVIFNGSDTARLGKKGRASLRNRSIGFVFQFHHLLPEFSAEENILFPRWIAGGLDQTTTDFAADLISFLGLKGLEHKKANQLSGGEKQRVAVARALINGPEVILADEPTGNLDTKNGAQVYQLFHRINKELGTAFFLVTHDRRIAQQTDRILEISDGRLVGDQRNPHL
jgi:lipoprotein-releasing system ATP-binding protein